MESRDTERAGEDGDSRIEIRLPLRHNPLLAAVTTRSSLWATASAALRGAGARYRRLGDSEFVARTDVRRPLGGGECRSTANLWLCALDFRRGEARRWGITSLVTQTLSARAQTAGVLPAAQFACVCRQDDGARPCRPARAVLAGVVGGLRAAGRRDRDESRDRTGGGTEDARRALVQP